MEWEEQFTHRIDEVDLFDEKGRCYGTAHSVNFNCSATLEGWIVESLDVLGYDTKTVKLGVCFSINKNDPRAQHIVEGLSESDKESLDYAWEDASANAPREGYDHLTSRELL